MGFFSRGLTKAVLSSWGKVPDERDWEISARMSSSMHRKLSLKNLVGMGSRGQVDDLSCATDFRS